MKVSKQASMSSMQPWHPHPDEAQVSGEGQQLAQHLLQGDVAAGVLQLGLQGLGHVHQLVAPLEVAVHVVPHLKEGPLYPSGDSHRAARTTETLSFQDDEAQNACSHAKSQVAQTSFKSCSHTLPHKSY